MGVAGGAVVRLWLLTVTASIRSNQIPQPSWRNRLAVAVVLVAVQCRYRVELSLVLDRAWVVWVVRVVTAVWLGLTAHPLLSLQVTLAITCQRLHMTNQRL